MRNILLPILASSLFLVTACAAPIPQADSDGDHDPDPDPDPNSTAEETLGQTSAALTATDPVATAVLQSCSTTSVKGLATQLVEEIQCLRPGTMKRIDNIAGLKLGAAVFPFLQSPAADALIAAQKARGAGNTTMSINSGLRTLPQQYLLYRWSLTGRCGIKLAAKPGTSNHESAIAVDIEDNAGWRTAMLGKSFRWLGASDPVHYDFTGAGAVELRGLSVKAFQRLWNRNHPEDPIAEDGAYGTSTAERLAKAPSGGFAKGGADPTKCTAAMTTPPSSPSSSTPSSADAPPDISSEPDATESSEDNGEEAPQHGDEPVGDATEEGTSSTKRRSGSPDAASSGCSAAPTTTADDESQMRIAIVFMIACAAAVTRRSRQKNRASSTSGSSQARREAHRA